ncbi:MULTISPECIES: metalloregulator ArsR/SmtB family transcription factor [Clostridium]|uniref:Helix-turn-helix transcriptional regulator n=1 Tax=Clostridium cibarium TaxID=2762247 RepID=A0ABR8PRC5_9CLOT|nr:MULTISPECIES: metalloregulator ArsR/SmtB family transcription factor [Clostridium]MBD7910730.1 helix-turn-helix transcriptional regulator [Clostridium cibarium]
MKYVKIFKALSNEARLNILKWLKSPDLYFPPQNHSLDEDDFVNGVCVGSIKDKSGLSQSTTSEYLSILQDAGFLESKRIGQWTYFKRNEEFIKQLSNWIGKEL